MAAPTLTTSRLVLRQLRIDDAATLHEVLSDVELMTWWSSGAHKDVAETADYLKFNASSDGNVRCWAITIGDDRAVGWVVLIESKPSVAELGFILHRDQWGQGVATEAVKGAIGHGFSELGLRRIFADCDPDNRASIALLDRLGFQREGRLREEWQTHIGVRDSLIFGLLHTEWSD